MVFRSLSEDDVHIFRDLPVARSTESHRSIGCEGGILHLDSCDVTMSIPPRTVQAGTCHDVSIALVTDDPPPIREREFLTGYGIGITFPAQKKRKNVYTVKYILEDVLHLNLSHVI
ncbi:uncharacterized protein LOC753709 [Strongylocentrotus purpuratus]|uniref:ZU5 domain-containing protein n=1 Tax=Strongylocentrotus purpuratus TaxID=7668 RepID=A0A7M7SUT7_STRPU|nr:uncharacterized protein LOC753709 [Strongylocentrotus purpuratus]